MAAILRTCFTRTTKALQNTLSRIPRSQTNFIRTFSMFGPDDVNLPPEIPECSELNIRLRAYDYVTLESFAKYAHNMSLTLGLDADTWPVPARTSTVQTYKTGTTNILNEFNLAKYERLVHVEDIPSTIVPILFEVLSQNMPEGVDMTVKDPDPEEDEFRFVPDIMLIELQEQVAEIDKAKEERRK